MPQLVGWGAPELQVLDLLVREPPFAVQMLPMGRGKREHIQHGAHGPVDLLRGCTGGLRYWLSSRSLLP